MLTWPHLSGDWAASLPEVEPVFFRVALEILQHEALLINCATASQGDRVGATLIQSGAPADHLVVAVVPSDDTWARDHGPLTVLADGRPRLLDFQFNGWGNKYPSENDNAITGQLARMGCFGAAPVESIELILEGGSIDSDGNGTLLTTSSCLLHPRRNAGYAKEALEQALKALLGADRVLWLQHGALEGDDTDGHIDMLARFCKADTLIYQACTEPAYAFHDELKAMEAELRQLRTLTGEPYRLLPLPWPGAKFGADGTRLPASYANYLVINEAVLVPCYEDPSDDSAARLIASCFPGRRIVQIPCLPLIQQFGSLHCLTMQFPEGVEFRSPGTG